MEFDHLDDSAGELPDEHPEHFQGDARIQRLPDPIDWDVDERDWAEDYE